MKNLFWALVLSALFISASIWADDVVPTNSVPAETLSKAQDALVVAYGYHGWEENTILNDKTVIQVVPTEQNTVARVKSLVPVLAKLVWIEDNTVYVSQYAVETLPTYVLGVMIQKKAKPGLVNALVSAIY